ncbi:MAG: threonylcarbamoyl-AMP synthase [Proteobacteria bacterium]|nr:threonylcarbamoyl-AMP synthase [Pseudomonadota bacterium]
MTKVLARAKVLPANDASISEGADILLGGGLVAFPTETVYGLGADATNDHAVASIFVAKGRPRFNPLIVHVLALEDAERLVALAPAARMLAKKFWPGALTLVLPRKPDAPISLLVSAGLDTVAVRAPSNAVARRLLTAVRRPLAAPSANASGHVSPTTAAHVGDELGDAVNLILDGGATKLGLESTVVGFEDEKPVLLRPGAVAREEIEAVVGRLGSAASDTVSSPGQLASHYAPRAVLRLNVQDVRESEALLAFGIPLAGAKIVRNLSSAGDPKEAAANLFAMLRELDASGTKSIAVMPIPERGLGEAINDRLRRAAAPRS